MNDLGRSLNAIEEKQATSIERRKKQEEERKGRIFNDKLRTKGLDVDAIEEQIRLKKEAKEKEKEQERAIANELLKIDQQIQQLHVQHEEAKRNVTVMTKQENAAHDQFKKTTAVPVSLEFTDKDPSELGVASFLKFSGEDPDAKNRIKRQKEQIAEWSTQDTRIKQERAKAEKEANLLYDKQVIQMQQRALELQKQHEAAKRAYHVAETEYNQSLATNKGDSERQKYNEESEAKKEEVNYHLTSDLLSENGNATSALSPTRVIPYAYKGMTPEQKRSILDEQERQRKEKEAARKAKEDDERKWAAQQESIQKSVLLREREVQRQKEALAKQLAAEQVQHAKEKKERYDHLYKTVYANQQTEDYFNQFNTSSR